jgi:hypothetical protein
MSVRALPPPLPPLVPVAPVAPRLHSDAELRAALTPFVSDYRARLARNRERHGQQGATMLGASVLSRNYSSVLPAISSQR